jgi:hypothetical protein
MEGKDEAFSYAQDLIFQLQNEFLKNAMRAIHSDNVKVPSLVLAN